MMVDRLVNKKIQSITFGVLSPKIIKKMAGAKVVTPELYDREGYPVDGGLMDTRLGVIDPGLKCRTCGQKIKQCPGHFGYIELARPVIHIKFLNTVVNLLKGTCRDCGRVLIPKEKMGKMMEHLDKLEAEGGITDRRAAVYEYIKKFKTTAKCPHCKAHQEKITLEKPYTILENEKRLSPIEIRSRFERIEDDDLLAFGINPQYTRPEWLILTILAIPPVTMRPSITLESGERSEDDLTHKLCDIVRINQRLFENINAGAPEIIVEDLWDLLQYHVTTYHDNGISNVPPARHKNGQPLRTLVTRIKSKEGRIRHNLAGKRTNFSARTVISPDPNLDINEVGVPEVMAFKLTVPERVTSWNMDHIKQIVKSGPKQYPGANYIVRPDGMKKRITDETKEALLEELQPGYFVERHIRDGDVAIFNRQPSLHRMSMMAHKIRVLPGKTLRINPAVCNPYNADFDGDEMNLHIPQTEEARAEAEILMDVSTQLISPGHGMSVIGAIQDSISGNYVLTKDLTLTRQEALDILFSIGVEDFTGFPTKEKMSGLELFSFFLPKDFNYKDEHIEIKKGKAVKGVVTKNVIMGESGKMLRALHKKYGAAFTIQLLNNIFRLGIEVLFRNGFTASIADTDISTEGHAQIEELSKEAYKDVENMIEQSRTGDLELFPGKTIEETLEIRILERLNKLRNRIGDIVAEVSTKETGTLTMMKSGARGKNINLAQMAACVGQQALSGGRVNFGYKDRTLSCFNRNDMGPEAHGFIKSGFKDGLKPHEFFFMAMTGRDSLMDTALRTPKSGYLYRRLANAMQDLRTDTSQAVRDATGNIVQFSYGEDGMDVSKTEGGTVNVSKIINEVMDKE